LARYGEVKMIRVEILYKGNMQDKISKSYCSKKEQKFLNKWWTKNFNTKTNELFNRYYSPFIHDGDNALEIIKIK
ncbi:hypothetical protein BVX93_00350, partial [bacterium B13(2017)]